MVEWPPPARDYSDSCVRWLWPERAVSGQRTTTCLRQRSASGVCSWFFLLAAVGFRWLPQRRRIALPREDRHWRDRAASHMPWSRQSNASARRGTLAAFSCTRLGSLAAGLGLAWRAWYSSRFGGLRVRHPWTDPASRPSRGSGGRCVGATVAVLEVIYRGEAPEAGLEPATRRLTAGCSTS